MTKRLKSKHKVDRRLKANIWGRPKSPFNSRAYPPGQHGQNKKGKPTDYGIQLHAKQKLKAYYGNISSCSPSQRSSKRLWWSSHGS